MPTVAEQEYYLKSQLANDEYRNNLAAKAAAQLNAQLTYENQLEMARRSGMGGNSYSYEGADAAAINEAYRNRPIKGAVVPTYMMPTEYRKTPRNDLTKTAKQVQSAIYTPKKQKALTKSQKIVIAEMIGKQITTKPKPRR